MDYKFFYDCWLLCLIFSVWVARRPPGYAFIDFDDRRDAEDAIREIDGMAHSSILYHVHSNRLLVYVFLEF